MSRRWQTFSRIENSVIDLFRRTTSSGRPATIPRREVGKSSSLWAALSMSNRVISKLFAKEILHRIALVVQLARPAVANVSPTLINEVRRFKSGVAPQLDVRRPALAGVRFDKLAERCAEPHPP